MKAADLPQQRPAHAKLLILDADGAIAHAPRAAFANLLRAGDLVVANDASTLPASLHGTHVTSGAPIEVRLAGRRSLAAEDVRRFAAVIFGAGDFRTRTEERPLPPALLPGDRLALGPLSAIVEETLGHPRLAALRFDGNAKTVWAGLARHGKPIQYAHVREPLRLWDVWTPIAGAPAAFEPPSAGFAIDWSVLREIRARGAEFATLTHAAGISSTGDAALDRRLPFDEPYRIPPATAAAVERARARGGRVIAIGTTVVRALEHAASSRGRVRAGAGLATQRIGPETRLRVVDAILSGTHEAGTSHYELLRAFTDDAALERVSAALEADGYRTHEFGDSMFIERRGGQRDETRWWSRSFFDWARSSQHRLMSA
ncbi:MAG TPA: S-adenosylmethionine:tRNA ribosyltransferase-isomerase [Paucimonas sp.]|nr:S-adenosylmethionine:tRNA ribosyltransferase-isomerase [Paucimonas sp.]